MRTLLLPMLLLSSSTSAFALESMTRPCEGARGEMALTGAACDQISSGASLQFYKLDGSRILTTAVSDAYLLRALFDSKIEKLKGSVIPLYDGGGTLAALEKIYGKSFGLVSRKERDRWVKSYHAAKNETEKLAVKAMGKGHAEISRQLGEHFGEARVIFDPRAKDEAPGLIVYSSICYDDPVMRSIYPPFSGSKCSNGKLVEVISVFALSCNPELGTLGLEPRSAAVSIRSPAGGASGAVAKDLSELSKGL